MSARLAGLLLVAALVLPCVGLGTVPLLDPDEPYYAIPAREMLASGNWLLTTFGGQPWLDKPPLLYWSIAGSFAALGQGELAARLPSALAAVLTILLIPVIARRLGLSRSAGLAAGLVYGTSVSTLVVARLAITDSMLTLWETLALLAVALVLRDPRPRWGVLWGLAGGLALLTKGPIGLAPILLGSLALLALGRPRRWSVPFCAAGTLLAVGLPWFALVGWLHPRLLFEGFLLQGNLGRMLEPEHARPAWYYVPALFGLLLPWSPLLPGAVLHAGSRLRRDRGSPGDPARPAAILMLAWVAAVLLPVSLAATRLPTYVVPALPALALLIGDYLAGPRAGLAPRAWARTTAVSGLALGGLTLAGAAVLFARPKWSASAPAFAVIALAMAIVAWVIVFAPRSRKGLLVALASGTAAGIVTLALMLTAIVPAVAPVQSTRDLVTRARAQGRAADIAGLYAIPEDFSLDWYLGRPLPRLFALDELTARAGRDPGRLWLIPRHVLPDVQRDGGVVARPFACHPRVCLVELSLRNGGKEPGDRTSQGAP
ncbi:MAG: hypothetical protein Kow0062_07140 [Acidobacteriota bacterium]